MSTDEAHLELAELEHASAFDDVADIDATARRATEAVREGSVRAGAVAVLRRGLRESPDLRRSLRLTVVFALVGAIGRLTIPILVQQVINGGLLADEGFRPVFTFGVCGIAAAVIVSVMLLARVTYLRLITSSEAMIRDLRVRTFAHVHRLTMAEHESSRRGELTARVTSDIETIARFTQWGAVAWIVDGVVLVGTLAVMSIYAWQLAVVTVVIALPLIPMYRFMQRRQLLAYGRVRDRVSSTLTEVSEAVQGAAPIRAYGLQRRARVRLGRAIDRQYESEVAASRWFALLLPLGDAFGALTITSVVFLGVWFGESWGLNAGTLLACVFLAQLLLGPIQELGEILDQTQTAIAGWAKVHDVLDRPVELIEPSAGRPLSEGPLAVGVEHVDFRYRTGPPVLHDVTIDIPAGAAVAVVGETGSGKTTFAKLLVRLADPVSGSITLGGVPLTMVDAASRRSRVRLVPQEGFMFDTTLGANLALGRIGATESEVRAAVHQLDLEEWIDGLPRGLDTEVGERGDSLSVGERQLVALIRAQLADPGLLVLDEATSAVDPRTEHRLGHALRRLAEGRTTVSVAHRLSTAEHADLVLVFDAGRLVEHGSHTELVAAGGRYAELYRSWLGNTGQESS
ncbi:MAG: ABC transporter ATP-binding protein [Acidimicrobiia bacterium]